MGTIARVLSGAGVLQISGRSGNRAEWSNEQFQSGSHSVKLSKDGIEGGYGSTGVQIIASGNAAAQTLQDFEDQALAWGWSHFQEGVAAFWENIELRFEDPDSESWVDITTQLPVMGVGALLWVAVDLADTDNCYFGGWSELDGSFSNFTPAAISAVTTAVAAGGAAPLQNAVTPVTTWLLTRIKVELWETVPPATGHYVYVDDIVIDGTTFTLEPGDTTTEAILLGAPYTDLGYTEDGVTVTYTSEEVPIRVDEETFQIDSVLASEMVEVTCNLAESSLFNMDKAMGGSLLSGGILKLGAGTQKKLTLQFLSTNPASEWRAVLIPSCVAVGTTATQYEKDNRRLIPVTFRALKTAGHPAVTIVDNAA